ncbi:LbetaH domain-containing protein [Rhodobacter maris]|uniref:Phosphonate metabolism protein (Transferase hexapeptide repeat family) n=1 Tax=Rhodobacter maris TaxID=446682 RepID=A0A285S8K6_9RHOB|nr:chloramphenicol acetyltransferase [Rhodobacter maris]SOC03359.1 phosphonate metabolism protein (transferase hexapeptide repeat family) [Rhodobacter maris]
MPKLHRTTPLIGPECEIVNVSFGAFVEVGRGSRLLNVEMQDYAYCDRFADIANTTVGRFSNIAAMTRIGPTDHPWRHAAQHHFLYRSSYYWDDVSDDAGFFAHRAGRRVRLGADCWIGHGAIIKPEVSVGIGAVVAAGAVVTKDVAPFMIVAGCPARPLKRRFSEQVAERLLRLAWWDWSHETLRARLQDFRTLPAEEFLERYEGVPG